MAELRAERPTIRSRLADLVAKAVTPIAVDERHAYRVGNRAAQAMDWVPFLGNAMGAQEGAQQAQRGYRGGSLSDLVMGAGGVALSAIPAARNVLKLKPGFQVLKAGQTEMQVAVSPQGVANLHLIRTPEAARGQGHAREAMRQLVQAADEQGLTLALTADPVGKGLSKAQLERFYRGFGFVPNKGRSQDFSISAGMVRPPRAR